jgi:alkanesulfonate monooxygenase SsuD/methylene tetrahydromethanopterin reductase-like flavin-dependent oxidoreductase (luciferase family)
VTAGYAIKFADELNYVFLSPEEIAERMISVRARCEAEGRDPATLRFSLYARDEDMRDAGEARVDLLGRLAETGLSRVVCFPTRWSPTLEAQAALAEDCRAAGISLAVPASAGKGS